MNITIPENLVEIAKTTIPENYSLEDWIIIWTEFGLEVSQKASSRKEAVNIASHLKEAAIKEFGNIVDTETREFKERLEEIEALTDLNKKEEGFGKLFGDIEKYVDPENTKSAIYQYNQMLLNVDSEDGLFRKAIRKELAKDGGVSKLLGDILLKLGLDEKEKEVSRKSTLKGDKIEDTLLLNLENLFPGNDLTFNKLTNTTGELKNSKKGDIILRFGPDHALHGCPIIYEMKSDDSFFLTSDNKKTSATHYLTEAMKNRGCKVGIFVMDKGTAMHNKGWKRTLTIMGDKIFIIWDPEDPNTDWLLTVATYIAIGRNKPPENMINPKDRDAITNVTSELEAEAERYSKMKVSIDNIQRDADKLSDNIRIGADGIQRCIKHAEKTLKILEMDSTKLTNINFDDVDHESGRDKDSQKTEGSY